MEKEKQEKNADTPVVSPLANEKTYGERVYSRVFDWGLNYWTNLLASAGFSQWAEHSIKPIKLPFMEKAESPRDLQQKLAAGVRKHDPFFRRFEKNTLSEMAGRPAQEIESIIHKRSMARARSLTLLMPGFAVMVPAVWLGAKIKPAFVEYFNRRHYGEDAMDDPSLKARHEAIAAEARPTFAGTMVARIGTVLAVQGAAQMIGSNENLIQKMGAKKFTGIDPFTEKLGASLGGALPQNVQNRFNKTTQRWGYDWSLDQRASGMAHGPYAHATQDLGRFIAADTVYTLITALAIGPLAKLLRFVPFMSYKPRVPENSATFDGEKVKVPSNKYMDEAPQAQAPEISEQADQAIITPTTKPKTKVNDVREHIPPTTQPEQTVAQL